MAATTGSLAVREEAGQAQQDRDSDAGRRWQLAITALILFGPLVGVVVAIVSLFGRGVDALDLALGVAFYAVSGHGVTAGFHRLLAHRGYVARRWTRIALCVAGSLAFEGTPISWVALHRRHHAYTDVEGDPHSPHLRTDGRWPRLRGAAHAHAGWLLGAPAADVERWAPDLAKDRDVVTISRLFPVLCVASLGAPALLGWAISGTAAGALGGFVWGGLVRVFVLQQATFAVNSACHLWGTRPFVTRSRDRSTNLAALAIVSMGESWHNAHHANPRWARHGVDPRQLDSTARLIRILQRLGLASQVQWPSKHGIEAKRRAAGPPPGGGPPGGGIAGRLTRSGPPRRSRRGGGPASARGQHRSIRRPGRPSPAAPSGRTSPRR